MWIFLKADNPQLSLKTEKLWRICQFKDTNTKHAEASHARIGRRNPGIGTGLHAQAEMGEQVAELGPNSANQDCFWGRVCRAERIYLNLLKNHKTLYYKKRAAPLKVQLSCAAWLETMGNSLFTSGPYQTSTSCGVQSTYVPQQLRFVES